MDAEDYWTTLTSEYTRNRMSPQLAADFAAWIAEDWTREGRVADHNQMVTHEFRGALRSNNWLVDESSELSIPRSCVRHALSIVFFELRKDMGIAQTESENIAATRADIFLRNIWTGKVKASLVYHEQTPTFKGAAQ
ncbi:hypothetical protein [Tichowtungia aerotolerans]|uniref:Uncharacterized protein n=1 Tax=Tichowtungia aerotolerans TaxID=2697043 RepID=A0A6P1M7M4_9BACT|nr:hypothetical protein [Tichowtungia aerotolerans]QHI69867.1 hypothetical protein GT409_10520 [Tichowtungia aerotolerans]